MAKEDNLISLANRPVEERREIARKGGLASGKVKQERATMKKTLEMILEQTNQNGRTYKELATLGLIKGAIEGKAENYKTILALLGELQEIEPQTPNVEIKIIDNSNLEKVLYEEDEE